MRYDYQLRPEFTRIIASTGWSYQWSFKQQRLRHRIDLMDINYLYMPFWGGGMTQDKLAAYQTLYVCLETAAKLMAPFSPFYADKLYMDLIAVTGRDNVESVHLSKFPECDENLIDKELEARMEMAQQITSMVLALRRKQRA